MSFTDKSRKESLVIRFCKILIEKKTCGGGKHVCNNTGYKQTIKFKKNAFQKLLKGTKIHYLQLIKRLNQK